MIVYLEVSAGHLGDPSGRVPLGVPSGRVPKSRESHLESYLESHSLNSIRKYLTFLTDSADKVLLIFCATRVREIKGYVGTLYSHVKVS